jgi:hypothetical protein
MSPPLYTVQYSRLYRQIFKDDVNVFPSTSDTCFMVLYKSCCLFTCRRSGQLNQHTTTLTLSPHASFCEATSRTPYNYRLPRTQITAVIPILSCIWLCNRQELQNKSKRAAPPLEKLNARHERDIRKGEHMVRRHYCKYLTVNLHKLRRYWCTCDDPFTNCVMNIEKYDILTTEIFQQEV